MAFPPKKKKKSQKPAAKAPMPRKAPAGGMAIGMPGC